jgi:hypothetical protein
MMLVQEILKKQPPPSLRSKEGLIFNLQEQVQQLLQQQEQEQVQQLLQQQDQVQQLL